MMRYARAKGIASMVMSVSVAVLLGMTLPSIGYGQFPPGQKRFIKDGDKLEVKGVILTRDGETFTLRDLARTDTTVVLTDTTKIRTERKGLFRGRKPFDVTVLVPELIVQVIGKGQGSRLVAETDEFSEAVLKAAI